MVSFARSFFTALVIAGTVLVFTVEVIAPLLPPVVGPPDMREVKHLKLPSSSILHLANADGSVRIRTFPPGEEREIDIEAEIKVYFRESGQSAAARKYIATLVSAVSSDDSLVIVTEPFERPDALDVRVDYTIRVPEGTDIEVTGSNGNVWISKGCGRVSVRGGNADIEIVEPLGAVIAHSTNGRIRVLDVVENASLETVNGNIYAHMRAGFLQASSSNGHIVARVLDRKVKGCELVTKNGGITVVLLEDSAVTLDAVTHRGTVRSDFPIEGAKGIQNRKHVRGTIGGGGTKLHVDTLNGNIWIARG